MPIPEGSVAKPKIMLEDISSMKLCSFDDVYPCNCCAQNDAMHYCREYDITFWYCIREEVMFRMEDNPNRDRILCPEFSDGMIAYRQRRLRYCLENNIPPTWSMIMDEEDYQEELTMTDEKRAAKAAAKALADAEQDLIQESSRMFNYAESQRHLNSRGRGKDRHIDKIDEPCKFLYCDESVPMSLWKKDDRGKLCAPIRIALTGSECWAHEYHDPRSKALKAPHTCKRLHPNEDGWRGEWNTNRTFRPAHLNNGVRTRPKRVENGAW
jgi:hypothetical protein